MKCIEANINEDHTLSVRYFHRHNSSRSQRRRCYHVRTGKGKGTKPREITSAYVTVATVRDGNHQVVGTGESVCSERDTPNRALGRHIAVGRALAEVSGRAPRKVLSTQQWEGVWQT